MKKFFVVLLSAVLFLEPALTYARVVGSGTSLPPPGQMVHFSPAMQPVLLRGVTINPSKPLNFDFIVDPGTNKLGEAALRAESQRMINYFLAALTVPQQDMWVNLSPVESDRIVPDALIKTELGRDLLAQDYVLKQLTASLIYPEDELGKSFWKKIYDEAFAKFGVTDVPVDVFNKVWIVPETAAVIEKGNTVYITKAHMKVMLEADYLAQNNLASDMARSGGSLTRSADTGVSELTKSILRDVIVPAIEREVNEGSNFARLRQVVYALVLAQWYQDVLKESVLNKTYAGKNKVAGIDLSDPKSKELIYTKYMAAYKTGVFNYIKEETDRATQEPLPKKYFSGGFKETVVVREPASPMDWAEAASSGRSAFIVGAEMQTADRAESVNDSVFISLGEYIGQLLAGYVKDLKGEGEREL